MIFWFGKSWGSALTVDNPQVGVPVGEHCIECTRVFKETDRGVVTLCSPRVWGGFDLEVDGRVVRSCGYHLKCWLDVVVGGEMSHEVMARIPGRRDEIWGMLGHHGEEDTPDVGGWRTKGST